MTLSQRVHDKRVFFSVLILSIASFAVPHASQDDASDEFILFVSDRAFPSSLGMCGDCEDIYVMPPAGELPAMPNAIRVRPCPVGISISSTSMAAA